MPRGCTLVRGEHVPNESGGCGGGGRGTRCSYSVESDTISANSDVQTIDITFIANNGCVVGHKLPQERKDVRTLQKAG